MDNNILNSITKIYSNRGYFELYKFDIIIAFLIIFITILIITYLNIQIHRSNIVKNWPLKRCNPLYIPFAGFIVKNKNESIFDATSKNFEHCANNIFVTVANDAFAPLYYVYNVINSATSEISSAVNGVRGMFNKSRTHIDQIASSISNRTLNVTMPLVSQSMHIKDSLSKVHGIATIAVNQLFGLFITVFSMFKFFENVIIGLLKLMAAGISALWVLVFIPFIGIPAGIAALAATVLFIAILVVFLEVIILIEDIFKYKSKKSPPPIPKK